MRPRIEEDVLVHDYLTPEEAGIYWAERRDQIDIAADGMLDAFIRIATPEDVLRFAARWGALDLCEHLVPNVHNMNGAIYGMRGCLVLGPPKARHYWEPLDRWFFFARSARAVLNVGAALQAGRAVPEELLSELGHWIPTVRLEPDDSPPDWWSEASVASRIETIVNYWLLLGGVRPHLSMEKDPPEISFYVGTFGVIGMQMMQALSRTQGITLCSSCGFPYSRPGRRVQSGRRNYCPSCGRTAALRDAQRSYSRRKKEGRAVG